MEFITLIEQFNAALEKSFTFRMFKYVLGFYLIIIVITLILILIRIAFKYNYWRVLISGQETGVVTRGSFQKRWDQVSDWLKMPDEDSWKAAILESSRMVNETLKTAGYEGETLGEKLSGMIPSQLDNLEAVKSANEVKNRIVQDETFAINKDDADRVVKIFADALRSYEAIDVEK